MYRGWSHVPTHLDGKTYTVFKYLRTQRAGQATFLPLDTISVKPVNDKFRSFAKGARLAVDVIQYEPAVERAMHHVCGNALVCDTMDVAKYVCWEKGQEVKGRWTEVAEEQIYHSCAFFSCYARRDNHP